MSTTESLTSTGLPGARLGSLTARTARLTAGAALVAPALLLASSAVFLFAESGVNNGPGGGTLTVWACIAFLAAFAGIYRMLDPERPRTVWWLTALAGAAFIGGATFGIDAIYEAALGSAAFAAVVEAEEWFVVFAYLPWGWLAPLSFVLCGSFLWRAKAIPWWNGLLLILGGILFVAGRPARIDSIVLAADVVLIVGFVAIAVQLLRRAARAAR